MPVGAHHASPVRFTLDGLLALNRRIAESRMCLGLGLLSALTGAGLATGIMAYEVVAHGENYTSESWLMIGPVWLGLAALWWLTTRRPFLGIVPFGVLAFFAGGYFSDVYGQFAAGLLLLLGSMVILAAATGIEGDLSDESTLSSMKTVETP